LKAKQTISSLPAGFAGSNFTSEVAVSPDARFVYAANQHHDTIAWFWEANTPIGTPFTWFSSWSEATDASDS
jgi:6-phosphogluconolactonase (cycloisomerase 2 family)